MNAPNVAIPSPKCGFQRFRKWVIMDATLDRTYLVDGQPASGILMCMMFCYLGVSSRFMFEGNHCAVYLISTHSFRVSATSMRCKTTRIDGYGVDLLVERRFAIPAFSRYTGEPFPETQKNLALLGSILGAIASVLCGVAFLRLSDE